MIVRTLDAIWGPNNTFMRTAVELSAVLPVPDGSLVLFLAFRGLLPQSTNQGLKGRNSLRLCPPFPTGRK